MNYPFNRRNGLIIVRTRIFGPRRLGIFRLALDTGASDTLISATRLEAEGFDLTQFSQTVKITTGGGVIAAPIIQIPQLEALGHEQLNFPVLAHDLPPTSTVDGVLGLDFMRGHLLTVDFRIGQLSLA